MKISPVSQINRLIHYVRVAAVKPNFHTATPEICTVIRELRQSLMGQAWQNSATVFKPHDSPKWMERDSFTRHLVCFHLDETLQP